MFTMCHYNSEKKKKKKRSDPLIAALEEDFKIHA